MRGSGCLIFFLALPKYDGMRFDPALFIAFTSFGFFVLVLLAETFNMAQTDFLCYSLMPSANE